jgi:FlaA1/EpsC-like NDP-sugar epimerase
LNDRQDIPLKVLGFIDDNHRFARMRVQGYPVLGTFDLLLSLISQSDVHVVVLNHDVDDERLARLEEACLENGVSLLRLHISIEELISTDGPSPATRLRGKLRGARG